MNKANYIIASCTISDGIVLKNNEQVFTASKENLQAFLIALYQFIKIDYSKFYKMDNLSKLGFLASEILLRNETIVEKFLPEEAGIVLSGKNSSLDTDIKYFSSIQEIASPGLFVYTLPNIVIGEIAIRNKIKGENACFIFENFDAVFIEEYVADLLNNNILKMCICGWIDVLNESYKATLFLVSKNKTNGAVLFSKDNMNSIFKIA